MLQYLNEEKRIESILNEGINYKVWSEDVKLLAYHYVKLGKKNKEIKSEIYNIVKDCDTFNRFSSEDLSKLKKYINKGSKRYKEGKELNVVDELDINMGIVNYINKVCDKDKEKILAFTLYVWCKLFNCRAITIKNYRDTFCNFLGIAKNNSKPSLEEPMKELIKKGMVVKFKDKYIVNFEISSNENYESPEEKEDYLTYVNRLSNLNRNGDLLPYYDSINFKGRIMVYPEEYRELNILNGAIPFQVVEKDEEILTLYGPKDYNTELCISNEYIDDLHNPGNFMNYYLNGSTTCSVCGRIIPKAKTHNKKQICRKCQYINKEKDELKKARDEFEEYRKGVKEDFIATCTYCGEEFKVKKDDPYWEQYRRGVKECPKCEGKLSELESNLPKENTLMYCEFCGKPYELNPRREDYWAVYKGERRSLCPKDKKNLYIGAKNKGIGFEEYVEIRLGKLEEGKKVKVKKEIISKAEELITKEEIEKLKRI